MYVYMYIYVYVREGERERECVCVRDPTAEASLRLSGAVAYDRSGAKRPSIWTCMS